MFPKVKNVNVESLKNGSKLLDFSQIVLNNLCHSFHPNHVENRVQSLLETCAESLCRNLCKVLCKTCVGFSVETDGKQSAKKEVTH